ncbi:MAG: Ig-like domain-containing protein, partial [Treponema sp.]|nr:Ig-like domain-containing protein [Treponema sp.]
MESRAVVTPAACGSSAGTAVSWSSSNPNVASVSDGKVNAIGAGRATITATAKVKSAYCVVT